VGSTYWNAAAYDGLSDPQFTWGMAVLARLELAGNERVLDAGCGSGRLTGELLRRLPEGAVVALDSSPQMLEEARRRLAGYGARVEFVEAGLEDFMLAQPVDGIFSNAVFHWVPNHQAMFGALHRALKPGGWLLAQFGGIGNLERAHRRAEAVAAQPPFAAHLSGVHFGPHFEDVESTRRRMEAAGFRVLEAGLHSETPQFDGRERYQAFLRTVVLRRLVACLPAELQGNFLERVAEAALAEEGAYLLDYVRLTVRGAAG
jgi:trans-aconitate 2-methyltransferase